MLKKMISQLVLVVGFLPVSLFSMHNGPKDVTDASILTSIKNCCAGQMYMTGRSQLRDDINNFIRSERAEFLIPNIPVLNNSQELVIESVTLVKSPELYRSIDRLDAALTMMSISGVRK